MKVRYLLTLLLVIIIFFANVINVRSAQARTPECDTSQISIPVLMYHYIHPKGEEVRSHWSISQEQLEEQMRWFYENGYSSITTDELYHFITTGKIENPKSFLPIFDDNWHASIKDRVLPVMSNYGFVPTLALYTAKVYQSSERGFTWGELKKWEEQSLVDVQSHSVTHPTKPPLTGLSNEDLMRELVESKETIERELEKTVSGFVTPAGSYDERVLQAATDAGYKVFYLLTERGGVHTGDDPMRIYRVNMVKELDFAAFVARMEDYSTPSAVAEACQRTAEKEENNMPTTPPALPAVTVTISTTLPITETVALTEDQLLDPLAENQIVAFYGHPSTKKLGILGEHPIEELAEKLRGVAAEYDAINGERGVIPAFHIIFGVVHPGGEIGIIGHDLLMQYINYAQAHGMIVILDHQLGKYEVTEAVAMMLPYLKYKCVHLAMDPEWHTTLPAQEVGHVTGAEVNAAQALIQEYMEENKIPGKKILVVHQFTHVMIEDREAIRADFPRVDLVHDADGFGRPPVKRWEYAFNVEAKNIPLKGFKLFYKRPWRDWGYDNPLMTPEEVLELEPEPVVIIYQ